MQEFYSYIDAQGIKREANKVYLPIEVGAIYDSRTALYPDFVAAGIPEIYHTEKGFGINFMVNLGTDVSDYKGKIVTHFHPTNSSFSNRDLANSILAMPSEVRVVTEDTIYSWVLPEDTRKILEAMSDDERRAFSRQLENEKWGDLTNTFDTNGPIPINVGNTGKTVIFQFEIIELSDL